MATLADASVHNADARCKVESILAGIGIAILSVQFCIQGNYLSGPFPDGLASQNRRPLQHVDLSDNYLRSALFLFNLSN